MRASQTSSHFNAWRCAFIRSPDEQQILQHLDAREEVAYREPTGMAFGRNGFLYVFGCPACPDHIAHSVMQ
jgi:hypothetical protein